MPLATGTSFAGYTIVRMLGTRGLGEVYLAQHPHLPRRDALKILPAAMTDDSKFHARFSQEAEIATTLHHPHIVQVHDRGECEGRLWTAMDYVDATDVAELMAERFPAGMPPGQVQAIITAVAEALDYAHQRGMLHRDVQPARILLTNPGGGEHRVLLTDFGIAGQLDDAGTSAATGLPLETRPYAAPEQLIGSEIDGRADQYGLAATAFHLLTGAPPYADPDPAAVTARANVSDRRVDLARFDSVFSTAFADDPADRFDSCLEFAQALTERAASSPGERTPEALLTLDYPGEAANTSKVRSGEDVRPQVTSRLRRRLPQSATATLARRSPRQPNTSATALTRRSIWVLLGIAFGAGLILSTALLAVGIFIGRKNGTTSTEARSPGMVTTTVAAAPTTKTTSAPPLVVLDGGYRLDLNRVQQTYNETPDPQPPNVTTWWAFRSSCTPVRCLASGVLLDDANHQTRNAAAGGLFIVLDLRADAWQSRPETLQFPCRARNGTAALETTTQVMSLRPQSHSSLQGTMTVTVQTNECGQIGGRIVIPAVAVRVSDVPPGVDVPSPPPMTTPTR
ncbi:MAG TPA: serine/threonine-protein kinase [Mycobacterium sp.]